MNQQTKHSIDAIHTAIRELARNHETMRNIIFDLKRRIEALEQAPISDGDFEEDVLF